MKAEEKIYTHNGLQQKYIIVRTDGTPVDKENEYFVLKVHGKGDQKHIEACKKALAVYADEVKDFLPELSKDLIERYSLKISTYER